MSRYRLFDRSLLKLRPIRERGHLLKADQCLELDPPANPYPHPDFSRLCAAIRQARDRERAVVLMMGGHPIKLGLSRYLIDLLERGWVTHLATNGAGIIHDFELATVGGTSEDVPRWISAGQFGLWHETDQLNQVIKQAAVLGRGLGEGVGALLQSLPEACHDLSLTATGWRLGVPVTAHVSVGSDIIHSLPACSGAALGQTSYTDFLIFAESLKTLQGGVFLNVGTAVTGPEVFLKALSMVRNLARQQQEEVTRFTTAVFDLVPLPADFREEFPDASHAGYYFRPWKSLLVRTVADGGQSFYFPGDHRQTIPTLWQELTSQ